MKNAGSGSIGWAVPDTRLSLEKANEILMELALSARLLPVSEAFNADTKAVVLHSAYFGDLEQLHQTFKRLDKPGLIVVSNSDEEVEVLRWTDLPITADICRDVALEAQMGNRLRRLLGAGTPTVPNLKALADKEFKHLYSREYLELRLAREFANAQKHCRSLSIAWFTLEHYDALVKTHGSSAAEQIRSILIGYILANIRVLDWLAEYSESELCLVMPDTWTEEGRIVTERIRSALSENPVVIEGQTLAFPKVDIVVSEMSEDDVDYEDMLQKAAETALARKIARPQTKTPIR